MNTAEFEGRTAEEVQSQFFLKELPSRERGRYYYRAHGLSAESGTIVLFQYDNRIGCGSFRTTMSNDFWHMVVDPLNVISLT
jgi:hypothetical protein